MNKGSDKECLPPGTIDYNEVIRIRRNLGKYLRKPGVVRIRADYYAYFDKDGKPLENTEGIKQAETKLLKR